MVVRLLAKMLENAVTMNSYFCFLMIVVVSFQNLSTVNAWTNTATMKPGSFARGISVLSTNRINTCLYMGIFDFLSNREGDFAKLDNSDTTAFGPGPLMVLYKVPPGVENEEILDMIDDGAPVASRKTCKLYRIHDDKNHPELDLSMKDMLNQIANNQLSQEPSSFTSPQLNGGTTNVPVLFFSGFSNAEMLAVYNILGREIYEETAGQANAACAKAVPNAMDKPMRQVLEEIAGDHLDAMQLEAA